MPKGLVVAAIERGSIAEEMEIDTGDRVLAVNGEDISDIVDFQIGAAEEDFCLLIEKPDGELWEIDIQRGPEEVLGLTFESVSGDGLKICQNNCVFCFLAQMPKKMRNSLYLKDDDYRLSLTQGSFITLSNLREEELERIISLHLSPLYISVHAWDPEVRARLMGNRQAGKLQEQIKKLAEAGITIHTQIVLLPGWNDGPVLLETVRELGNLYPAVQSVAVVPVGLTRFREGLVPLRGFTPEEAAGILSEGEQWQRDFKGRLGRHLVCFADEFYVLSGRKFPDNIIYDDFSQLENGVGMTAKFYSEMEACWDTLPEQIPERRVHVVTGFSARMLMKRWQGRILKRVKGLNLIVHGIRNDFFGPEVTAAGLITAGDIVRQIEKFPGEEYLIPRVMLKADEDIFLDDRSVEWLEKKLGGKVTVVENHGYSFLREVLGCSF